MAMSTTAKTAAIASIIGVCLSVIPGLIAYGAMDTTVKVNSENIKDNRSEIVKIREKQSDFNAAIQVLRESDKRQEEMLSRIILLLEEKNRQH